ncbi:3499_t:CDS:2 [Cetraspora pellucida]|uniref:3499_t:CDS:1 n=1 Tax=Cetraspora pellucida TaxID=1433469 RepID=A0A9N9J1J7_9GLOM|nr:3499_t:CDS:2 [Cetraspora pellucida]
MFRERKLDYKIYFWIKSFKETGSTIYKDEQKLLQEFKLNIFKQKKKKLLKKKEELFNKQVLKVIKEQEERFTQEKISGNQAENENSDFHFATPIRSSEYHPQLPLLYNDEFIFLVDIQIGVREISCGRLPFLTLKFKPEKEFTKWIISNIRFIYTF